MELKLLPIQTDERKKMKGLKGKIAFVTGASRGIGRAIALKLADNGVHVIVNYLRKKSQGEETAAEIKAKGVNSIALRGNVANDDDIHRMFGLIDAEFGTEGSERLRGRHLSQDDLGYISR